MRSCINGKALTFARSTRAGMKLSVIIVNYNVRYFLEQALLSVRRAARRVDTEIFVVDNNSVDGSVAMVREKFPEVILIANSANPGFAVANNQAIRLSRGQYVLLLNPDTVVEEDTFEKCAAFMDAHPQAGALGVRMIDGAGNFLPESKRGFPSPWVAFAKTFGLSRLFPRSRRFNHYHLGYLSADETQRVEVLAGAFMWLRRAVLDEVGLLDEAFFMYGEDIDLSYRIIEAGYANYYLPTTTIIHYKGESTKKGSLNYVRTFYQAMIIFARKHFRGRQANLFVAMLQLAIYFRAALTLVGNLLRRSAWPLADALGIYTGLFLLKHFWAVYHFRDATYYDDRILYTNFPLYVGGWLLGIYLSGGYDRPLQLRRLVRGLFWGTLGLAALYGLLGETYRPSRALLLLGAGWALFLTLAIRSLWQLLRHGNLRVGRTTARRLAIVGSASEADRVLQLLQRVGVRTDFIGRISPSVNPEPEAGIARIDQLQEAVRVFRIDELIFCSRDLSIQSITQWMTRLGPRIQYRILPEDSLSIIGSHSKNSSGELYTIDIRFRIDQPALRRSKRLLDLLLSVLLLPFALRFLNRPPALSNFICNCWTVFRGHKTWVGYAGDTDYWQLPPLPPGVLSPLDMQAGHQLPGEMIEHLNLLYARDYSWENDGWIVINNMSKIGFNKC